jgi:hypothetical protein
MEEDVGTGEGNNLVNPAFIPDIGLLERNSRLALEPAQVLLRPRPGEVVDDCDVPSLPREVTGAVDAYESGSSGNQDLLDDLFLAREYQPYIASKCLQKFSWTWGML